MTRKKLDAESVLRTLAQMRNSIPGLRHRELREVTPTPADVAAFIPAGILDTEAVETFEMMAVADALGSFAEDLQAMIDAQEAKLMDDCLRVYYAAVELARDPANADLIAHVEAMARAYEKSYGKPIPPRPEDGTDTSPNRP